MSNHSTSIWLRVEAAWLRLETACMDLADWCALRARRARLRAQVPPLWTADERRGPDGLPLG